MSEENLEELIEKYTLSDEMHNSILKTRIIPRLLIPATRVLQPKLIIKTGQCGAGKVMQILLYKRNWGQI